MHSPTILAPVLLVLVSGCATLSMSETGFIEDYESLEPAPERTVAFIPDEIRLYRNPKARVIDSIWLAPIEIRLAEDSEAELDQEDGEDLKTAFENYLRRNIGESYEVVESPGPTTAAVRVAITDVDPSSVLANIVGIILVVPFDMGGISAEIDISDSISGESLIAMKACRAGTPFLVIECFQRWGHAYHGMHKWTLELKEMLDELQPHEES